MATYIQGVTDYIPEIQQYQPDFDFFNTMLEKRQSLYDEAREKIADVYNSVLNNPMLRESDIKKREEFFKQIDGDIKKISRMDLSLRQNQQQAMHVFSQLLDDKNIAHDMVFTKKANEALKYGEYLREKGDSGYWAGMSQNIQYDMLGYKNADDETAMQMSAPKYYKRVDIMNEAMKKVKDMKFDVTTESPYVQTGWDKNGQPIMTESKWIIKRKNGELVETYIQSMLMSEYASRGDVMDYYREKAKNERLNWATQHASEYGSFDEANKAFIQTAGEMIRENDKKLAEQMEASVTRKTDQIEGTKKALEEATTNEDQTSVDYYNKKLQEYVGELERMQASSDYMTMQDNQTEYNGFTAQNIDARMANSLLAADIINAAKNASMIGYEMSYSVNPYKKMEMEHAFELQKMALEYQYKKDLEDYKKKKENEVIPNGTTDIGYQDGGIEEYDSDLRGEKVIDEYLKISTQGTSSERKSVVLSDAVNELRRIAESDSPNNWRAKEILSGIILDYLPEEEKAEITSEVGGDYNKIYEKVKGTQVDFRNANPYYIQNAYEKIKNNYSMLNNTRANNHKLIALIKDNDLMLENAFGGQKRDLSAAVEMLDDEEKAIVRAYLGLRPGDKYEDWDGTISGFDEYFQTAQAYLGSNPDLTRKDIIKYWENGKAKKLTGEQIDKISQKTQYAISRGLSNMGLDGKAAKSRASYVNNNIYDSQRVDVSKIIKIAANSAGSIILDGMKPSKDATDVTEDMKEQILNYAANLDNVYDGKSKAAYNYGLAIHPIAMGDSNMFAISIKNPQAKDDDNDYQGLTIVVPKEELRGKGITMFDATDKRPYDNMLAWAQGPIPLPELHHDYLDMKNNGKDITIGADASGRIYTQGNAFIYDTQTGYAGPADLSRDLQWGTMSADEVVSQLTELIYAGEQYRQQHGYK